MKKTERNIALFILLFSLAYANQYDPHLFPAKGPFVETWYSRIIDFESNHSFGIHFGQVLRGSKDLNFGQYPLNIVSLLHSRGDDTSLQTFQVFPSNDDIEVTAWGESVTTNPDFKSPASFEWKAKPYGYFRVNEHETRFNFTNIGGVSFIGILGPPKPWGPYGEGPEGWIDGLPVHWFVYSLGSELINYNWVNEETGEMLRGRRGVVYQQKTWGNGFPLAWIQGQGVDGPSGSSFAISLGVLEIAQFNTPTHLIGYRSSALTLNFHPTNSEVMKYIDTCHGAVNITVKSHTHKLTCEIQAPPSTLQTCLLGPTDIGFAPVSVECYIASAYFHLYKMTSSGYLLIESRVFHSVTLHLGGLYLCQGNTPCQESWNLN